MGYVDVHDRTDGGGLRGPVGRDLSEYLAIVHRKAHIVDRFDIAVRLDEVVYFELLSLADPAYR
jgi:hypothetical protein